MKNYIVITGGAGFVGTNLIQEILKISKKKIISLDNYSSGSKKNHIKNKRIKYLNHDTSEINRVLYNYKKKSFPNTENFYSKEVSIPIFPGLKERDQLKFINLLKKYLFN